MKTFISLLAFFPVLLVSGKIIATTAACSGSETSCASGCCPLLNAVCCADASECCPTGNTCIPNTGICIGIGEDRNGSHFPVVTKSESVHQKDLKEQCSGGFSCPDDQTCCTTGCCPFPNAVCCSDGIHCCPVNSKCDLQQQGCISEDSQQLMFVKVRKGISTTEVSKSSVVKESNNVNVVYCPGGTTYCPDYNTCCILPNGQWGCCPYPSAVCCNDRIHCCPAGSRCDSTSQHCLQGADVVPWQLKQKALNVNYNNIF